MTETTKEKFDAKSWVCVGYRKQNAEDKLPRKLSDFKAATYDEIYDQYWNTEWELFTEYVWEHCLRPKMVQALETGEGFSHRFGKQFVLDAFGFDPEDCTKLVPGKDSGATAPVRLRHCELFLKKLKEVFEDQGCKTEQNVGFVWSEPGEQDRETPVGPRISMFTLSFIRDPIEEAEPMTEPSTVGSPRQVQQNGAPLAGRKNVVPDTSNLMTDEEVIAGNSTTGVRPPVPLPNLFSTLAGESTRAPASGASTGGIFGSSGGIFGSASNTQPSVFAKAAPSSLPSRPVEGGRKKKCSSKIN